jgi:hypothetical protein
MVVTLILLIAGLVCFLVATIVGHHHHPAEGTAPTWGRTNFVALGLAFWILTEIIGAFPG